VQATSQSNIAFDFVRTLAAELSVGHIDLPSFPEIAIRVRKILADPKASVEQVTRVVGSEPSLAARLLRIANSASLNRSGKTVTDLRTAINRLGYNMVRSAAMSFAMSQIKNANKLDGLAPHLNDLWQRSICVAAYCFVLARNHSRINADEAMLAGMMHGIGKLYILARATGHAELFADEATLNQIIEEWHASIGRAILENWDFPESMARAVGEQADFSHTRSGAPDLSDIVAVATVIASYGVDIAGLELMLPSIPGAQRLGLDPSKMMAVMQDSAAEVTALTQALGS
jgi:HD-like signal output (HDOD) protein